MENGRAAQQKARTRRAGDIEKTRKLEKTASCNGHRNTMNQPLQRRTHTQKASRQRVEFRTDSVYAAQVSGHTRRKPLFMVRPAGIEPATPAFGGQYSIH